MAREIGAQRAEGKACVARAMAVRATTGVAAQLALGVTGESRIVDVMLHHVSLGTADLNRARAFYDPVMATVGLRLTLDVPEAIGYGAGITTFSLNLPADGAPATAGNGVHVAFEVERRADVEAFFQTAIAHGGTADGAPALRPEYDPNYFAAFVRDPDGNKIEALTFAAN